MEFEKQLEEWMKLDYVLPEDLPNIELYMDQVTTFLEEQLKNTKRFEEDKIFTKTMINNYTKNHLLPPSNKKKYSRNHMILLIYIYYLKNNHKDTSEYDGKLDVFKSSLETAQNALDSANDNYASVLKNTDRSVASAQNTVDMQKYQASTTTESKDQLEQLQKQLADCTLSAPIGGVVTAVNVSVGDKNTAGTTMITIEDTSSLKVIVNVEEADILKIQEGMPATVSTDATGDEEIKGTVTRVVRVKNQSTNTNGTDTNPQAVILQRSRSTTQNFWLE